MPEARQDEADLYGVIDRAVSLGRRVLVVFVVALVVTLANSAPAAAATDVNGVLDNIRGWVAGVLAGLATLLLTIGGIRYLLATGNQRALEEGKAAIRSALVGYAIAALAPMFIDILRKLLGA